MSKTTVMIAANNLRLFARDALQRVGMPTNDATLSADAMVWADLRGRYAHGISSKLPQCVARIRGGGTSAGGDLELIRQTPVMAILDGCNAWGQVAAAKAMNIAIENAQCSGVGMAVVRDVSSAASLGYFAMMAVMQRMVGMVFTNGPALIAPTGGTTKILGNQAHAFGCPAGRNRPVIYDASTTTMSTSEMDLYHDRGEPLPEGVLYTATGEPTRDAGQWVEGLLAPAGGHRGYGLSLMFEILTGVLAGGRRFGPDLEHPFNFDQHQGVSLLLVAVDPQRSMDIESFTARVDDMIDRCHSSPPAKGTDRIYMPGERSALMADNRERNGIPLPTQRAATLASLGDDLGVPFNDS